MLARVRCPAHDCAAEFDVRADRLGRNLHCPVCRVRLTARPAGIGFRLAERQRRARGTPVTAGSRLPLAVLVDNVRSLWNVGSVFRTADACGVREIALAGISGCPPRAEISKTALGADRAVAWRYWADPLAALSALRGAGYEPVAVEISPRAVSLERMAWPAAVCLVVGNEVAGVSPAVLSACERHVSIPMRGTKGSLNVAVAFGIVAHAASQVLERRLVERAGAAS
jgi:tRNA G18 (ribose-2'-O)-methylase SpoU